MHKEKGEKRDFLPAFFARLSQFDAEIVLEKGYGAALGFSEADYLQHHPGIRFGTYEECYQQALVVVVRSPDFATIEAMRPGTGLMTMLHYDTRPKLLQLLKSKGIQAFSLDAIVDDEGKRQVVTYEMTAYGGVREAFRALAGSDADIPADRALKVAILGMGNLGFQAARYAYQCFREFEMDKRGWRGVSVEFLEREVTPHADSVRRILQDTDVLIDASRRPDATQVIIPNAWLGSLPAHAVVLDLTADPYEQNDNGLQGKAIEGLPHGHLDHFVFRPDEPEYYEPPHIPAGVDTRNRRVTISCNAWPGVVPDKCMEEYGKKIWPYLHVILSKGFEPDGASADPYERALYRSTIRHFEQQTR